MAAGQLYIDIQGFERRGFATVEALATWAEKERQFWQTIFERIEGANPWGKEIQINSWPSLFRQLFVTANAFAAAPASASQQALINVNQAVQAISTQPLIPSDSNPGRTILALSETNPSAAWIEVAYGLGGRANNGRQIRLAEIPKPLAFLDAWESARVARFDVKAAVDRQNSALADLLAKWDDVFREQAQQEDVHSSRLLARTRLLGRLGVKRLWRARSAFQQHRTNLEDMRVAFSTEMRLRAAETFWSRKRKVSRKRQESALLRFYITGGLGLFLLVAAYYGIYQLFGLPETFNLAHALIYFVPTLLFVWILRIFANEYRSNKNQADDAEEREAMVLTFKALEYDGNKVSDKERVVILNALFRPANAAPGEETVPNPVWEAILAQIPKPADKS